MSLINDMLRDLEQRRKQEECRGAKSEKPVAVNAPASIKLFLWAGGGLLLAAVIWLGMTVNSGLSVTKPGVATPGVTPFATQAAVAPGVEKVNPAIIGQHGQDEGAEKLPGDAALPTNTPVSTVPATETEPLAAKLLQLGVVEKNERAQLNLFFAQRPEYHLLQNGTEMAQLVVSFSQTQIGANFAIPPLTGNLIKRLSLIPIKQTLQLLVDLDQRAQVQSFQVVDDPVQGYRLLIEIVATAEVAEKAPGQMSPFRSNPAGAEKSAEVVEPSAAKVSKNNNLPSRDREAYQAGLEQLKRGDVAAAEVNFNQALSVNPGLQEARLELINLLQQQRKLDRAEYFLQQGLSLAPENFELRKTYARLLLNDQRREEAVDLLQAEPLPGLTQDLEYHALLAALLQETGQFKAASSIYTQLVQVQPSALWWLGLAISLDQSGHPERARNAYQQAMSLPGLRPDLQSYIQSRLQVL